MLGAIIGDLAGSVYEYDQFHKVTPIKVLDLIQPNSFISDDTILTIAVANAILTDKDYEKSLKTFGIKYENMLPKDIPYFKTMFSPSFSQWLHGNYVGTSLGNGAMMRVSPIGYLFDTEQDIEINVFHETSTSHNTEVAIINATIVAKIILFARLGYTKAQIKEKLNLKIIKPRINNFNYTCAETIDLCLYSLFTSNNFEEALRLALSFGGDTDTNACIVGSMAEAMYGIDDELKTKALSYLPREFQQILMKAYKNVSTITNND